jgi:uncharacterized phage protein (TIGR01671 family)
MREIKFRGFNRKNGVWLYGFYLQNRGAHFVCPDEFAEGKSWDDYEIDPKTRGEYTGQKDKNGQEIYEGDVLRWDEDDESSVVVYDSQHALFGMQYQGGRIYGLYDCKQKELEVIGNIHDRSATQGDACQSKNPELLKP